MPEAHFPSEVDAVPRLRISAPTSPCVRIPDSDGEDNVRNTSALPPTPQCTDDCSLRDTIDVAAVNHHLTVPTQQRRQGVTTQRRASPAAPAEARRIPELDEVDDQYERELEKLQREREDCIKAVREQDRFVDEFRIKFTRTKIAVAKCIAKLEAASTMADIVQALRAAKREVRNIPAEPEVASLAAEEVVLHAWVRMRDAALKGAAARVEATLRETRPLAEDFASTLATRVTAFMQTNQGKRIVASAPAERKSLCQAIQQLHGALVWRVLDLCDASLEVLAPLDALRQQLLTEHGEGECDRNDGCLDELRQERRSQPSAERHCAADGAQTDAAAREVSPDALSEAVASAEEVDLGALETTAPGDHVADADEYDHPDQLLSSREQQACSGGADGGDSESPGGWFSSLAQSFSSAKDWLADH